MKRILLSLSLGLTFLSTPASAWVGGPFDNGFHSASQEQGAVYHGSISMNNGSGYFYMSPSQELTTEQCKTAWDFTASLKNRSVVYYKGITYIGSCFGNVDGDAKRVEGFMNGSSESGLTVTTAHQSTGFFSTSTLQTSVSNTIVQSNRNFVFNGNFVANVYQTAPSSRFRGNGEMVFLSQTSRSALANLTFNSYQGLINAIISFVGSVSSVTTGAGGFTLFTDAQDAIGNALNTLEASPYLGLSGVDNTYQDSEQRKIRVTGTRRYF